MLIADAHRMFLDALRAVLTARGFKVIGAVEDGLHAVALAEQRRPHVAVLDAAMPVMNGLEAAREILRVAPRTAILMVSGLADDRIVREALRIGVHGFVVKAEGIDTLLQAIADVSSGAIYVSPCYYRALRDALTARPAGENARPTARELEMLRLIANGSTMKQAAALHGISTRTAEWHRAGLMHKLRIHDTAGLVRYAIREGVTIA